MADNILSKEKMLSNFRIAGDLVLILMAWTKRKPKRIVKTLAHETWHEMEAIRDQVLNTLPGTISAHEIAYLRKSKDQPTLMLYCIMSWFLGYSSRLETRSVIALFNALTRYD
ncbi:hypothetical protein HYV31_01825 [candidate division WWE3 bacterium]|nr:hypothetical protein [candidate division WWE3 bacterium]